MMNKIASVVGLLVVLWFGYAWLQPDEFQVERSIQIAAPPEAVFALVDDLEAWSDWSPWEKLDPDMEKEYGRVTRGPGAQYSWRGNDQVGEGSMEIVESLPTRHIVIALDFVTPFEAHNTAEFLFEAEGDGTRVTWLTSGENTIPLKLMSPVFDMDDMLGGQFEAGLEDLKRLAEGPGDGAVRGSPRPRAPATSVAGQRARFAHQAS